MKLEWSRRAQQDLAGIAAYISADDPASARQWIEQLRRCAKKASTVPGIGRRVPEYAHEDIREVLLRTYRIIYLQLRSRVVVLTVTEGHRLLPALNELRPR